MNAMIANTTTVITHYYYESVAKLLERGLHRRDLQVGGGRRRVDHVQDDVRLGDLLQRRVEARDELRGEALDEAHGVDQHALPA